MTGYVRKYDNNETMSFKVSDKQLLKNTTKYWKNVKSLLNIRSESALVYGGNDKYIKTIKTYGGSVITSFLEQKNA